jgi:Tol biopolymer transport system component
LGNGLTKLTIYVANTDATGLRKITTPSGNGLFAVRWSPDGRRLLFVNYVLSVVNVDGSGLQSFDATSDATAASWSATGQQIAYTADAEPMRIFSLKDRSVRAIPVRLHGDFDSPDWQRVPQKR